jgi:hypothetical protein
MVMKDLKRIEESKLIAAFMGRELHTDDISWFDEYYKPLRYEDWNSLMPVIEKIESLYYIVRIHQNICIIKSSILGSKTVVTKQISNYSEENTKFSNTYKAVVEFINWYNKNK